MSGGGVVAARNDEEEPEAETLRHGSPDGPIDGEVPAQASRPTLTMRLTRYRKPASTDSEVSFPVLGESWNPMTHVATIAAEVNGARVLCRVSIAVLEKRFSATAEAPMEAVAENRLALRAAATKLIEKQRYEDDGSIVIRVDI